MSGKKKKNRLDQQYPKQNKNMSEELKGEVSRMSL